MRSFLVAGVALVAAITDRSCGGCRGAGTEGHPGDVLHRSAVHRASADRHQVQDGVTPDGKMTREPIGSGGSKRKDLEVQQRRVLQHVEGLDGRQLLKVVTAGDNNWSVMRGESAVADLDK